MRPKVTKLGMYVRYGHPKNPIDFGVQRSRSLGSTSPNHNKLLNISPHRRWLVQCLCLFLILIKQHRSFYQCKYCVTSFGARLVVFSAIPVRAATSDLYGSLIVHQSSHASVGLVVTGSSLSYPQRFPIV